MDRIEDFTTDESMRGNVICNTCDKSMPKGYKKCIFCCDHKTLTIDEDWEDHGFGLQLDFVCDDCGNRFDFLDDQIMNDYKVVKK